jgi:hypothetical protein
VRTPIYSHVYSIDSHVSPIDTDTKTAGRIRRESELIDEHRERLSASASLGHGIGVQDPHLYQLEARVRDIVREQQPL